MQKGLRKIISLFNWTSNKKAFTFWESQGHHSIKWWRQKRL